MAQNMKHGWTLVCGKKLGSIERKFREGFGILGCVLALVVCQKAQAQDATVAWTTIHQTMDGFGGEDWIWATDLTAPQAGMFFSSTSGIGLQIIRTSNQFDGSIPDLTTLQGAAASGAQIELGLQSPPCTLKWSYVENGEACVADFAGYYVAGSAFFDGTASSNGTCLTATQPLSTSYAAWAAYIVNYVNTLAARVGSHVAFVDVQNEASFAKSNLGSCVLNAAAYDAFIGGYLGPAFASASWNSTQQTSPLIMMTSYDDWFQYTDWASQCLNDPVCAPYVSIVAAHAYDTYAPTAFPAGTESGRHLWVSEVDPKTATPYDSTMTSGLIMAKSIHNFMLINASGYEWWELAYPSSQGNYGITDASNNYAPAKRYYVEGQWSKFIRPGWVRIDTGNGNPQGGVYVTAFKDTSTGSFTIVAVNSNTSGSSQSFRLNGFPSVSSVTPYTTSPTENLAAQSSVNASGGSFTFSLPAQSVTTFVGTAGSSSVAGNTVAPPTALKVAVQ
jgi:glucuronoarabinoxylan endo-1,4-beta-xylanase